MSLLKELQTILDLKSPFPEAEKKLSGTFMIVNGEIGMIKEFASSVHIDYIHFSKGRLLSPVVTLEPYLPDSGLYQHMDNDMLFYVQRLPKKQWFKSLHHSFYKVYFFNKRDKWEILDINTSTISTLFRCIKKNIVVTSLGEIYYNTYPIGEVDSAGNIICTNDLFSQELKDWVAYE